MQHKNAKQDLPKQRLNLEPYILEESPRLCVHGVRVNMMDGVAAAHMLLVSVGMRLGPKNF